MQFLPLAPSQFSFPPLARHIYHSLILPQPSARRGVFLGDSWIAPVDFSQAWLPYLKALSLLDGREYDDMQRIVDSIKVLQFSTSAQGGCAADHVLMLAPSSCESAPPHDRHEIGNAMVVTVCFCNIWSLKGWPRDMQALHHVVKSTAPS